MFSKRVDRLIKASSILPMGHCAVCDDDFGFAFEVWIILFVDFLTENEGDQVSVLLNGAGFAEVGELGRWSPPGFWGAAQLGKGDDGDAEFLGDGF